MIRHLSILILLIFCSGLYSQEKENLKPRIIKQWSLSSDFTEEVVLPFDTVFSLFNRYRIADRYSPVNAYPGNYGLPFYQIRFFDRINHPDKYLYYYYYPVMYLSDRTIFMNTQVPFTELVWTFGGTRNMAEQTFRVRHSQNINRFLNFGLIYDIIYSLGQYSYQRSDDKNFTFYTSYTGDKYNLYFSAGINNLTSNENGGIKDKSQLEQFETRDIAVNLGGLNIAKNFLKNNSIMLVQRYTPGKKRIAPADSLVQNEKPSFRLSGTFSHIVVLETNKRTYSDNSPESGYYDTVFINKSVTFDSLYSHSLKNTLRFDFTTDETRKFRLGGGFGIRNELFKYSQIIPSSVPYKTDAAVWRRTDNILVDRLYNVLLGRLYNDIGEKFRWIVTGELYLNGNRAGDFSLNGEISKSFDLKKGKASWIINGDIASFQPSFWYEQGGSNHFKWQNNFNKEFRIDIGTNLSYPARKAEIIFNYAVIDNYTDFGYNALPSQHTGGLSVAALTVSKELSAWKFHLASDIILQQSSNPDVLDLPLVTLRSAGYFEHLFLFKSTNGRLNTQLGFDLTYHTLYHPYAYLPSTGRFYRQDQVTTGNYPFLNVFLNLKLKRTRMFFMFDHVNSGLTGYNYFLIPSYPMNIRMFRYGVAWTFYD